MRHQALMLFENNMLYFQIALAGGIGAVLRFALGRLTVNLGWTALPFGTLFANLLGCFLIGYLSWIMAHRWGWSLNHQTVIMTGLLGGFTTFSAFSLETITLLNQGSGFRAMAYIALTVTLSICMCWLGLSLARQS